MGGDKHDASYYGKCMIGGIMACGLTHAAICPLDIIKCRMQVHLTYLANIRSIPEHTNPSVMLSPRSRLKKVLAVSSWYSSIISC
jgi:hypothetical protein